MYPDCESVFPPDFPVRTDRYLAKYAKDNGFLIVSKDSDFIEISVLDSGPKMVRIKLGNCSTQAVHLLLRNNLERITEFAESDALILELP